jgi:hypothetical protein
MLSDLWYSEIVSPGNCESDHVAWLLLTTTVYKDF